MSLVAVLDACVLYSAPVRDNLLHFNRQGIFSARWSARIEEEWSRNLSINRPDLGKEKIEALIRIMNQAFPQSLVPSTAESFGEILLLDQKDEHVVRTALQSNASWIFTFNVKDFPNEAMAGFGITSVHPDIFLSRLIVTTPLSARTAFLNKVHNLKNPPQTHQQVLSTFRKCNLHLTSTLLEQLLP